MENAKTRKRESAKARKGENAKGSIGSGQSVPSCSRFRASAFPIYRTLVGPSMVEAEFGAGQQRPPELFGALAGGAVFEIGDRGGEFVGGRVAGVDDPEGLADARGGVGDRGEAGRGRVAARLDELL